jgi:hypothetical protein
MRRKRNWFIKRLVLGFAVAALVVPSAAMAAVDEGGAGQPNSTDEIATSGYVPFVTDFPKYEATSSVSDGVFVADPKFDPKFGATSVKAGDYGMPRAMPSDYAALGDDAIDVTRTHDRFIYPSDTRNVQVQPGAVSTPEVVSAGFDWGDAGIGAGVILGLVLVGGAVLFATRQVGKPQTA